jgi:hypothetical protein
MCTDQRCQTIVGGFHQPSVQILFECLLAGCASSLEALFERQQRCTHDNSSE